MAVELAATALIAVLLAMTALIAVLLAMTALMAVELAASRRVCPRIPSSTSSSAFRPAFVNNVSSPEPSSVPASTAFNIRIARTIGILRTPK
jgi:hypothetical protein